VRVLFTSVPGWGHIHPMVPLASAFLDRGDEVLWATGAEGCARLERDGFPAAAAGLSERDGMLEFNRRFPQIRTLTPQEWPDFMFPRLFGTVRAASMLDDLLPTAQSWSPDLVVCDAAELAGPIVAGVLGVPNVTHAFGALLPEARVAAASAEVAPLWAAHGLEPRPYAGSYDHLYLDIYPPSLQPAKRPHVSVSQCLRPVTFATAGDEQLPGWLTAPSSAPIVYITLGTVFGNDAVLSTVVAAVRELEVRVVVTVGPLGDPASLGEQPSNVHVARYIPQDHLLPHCAAVVSHAGSGTFLATLSAGHPQLCVPQAADQFLNAAACARSGTGLALQPEDVSSEQVRHAAERLLSDTAFRAAAQGVRREIAAMSSPHDVTDRLHAL